MKVRAERIEELVHKLDSIADPQVQSVARALIQSITELHVAGLERVLEIISESEAHIAMIDQIGEDELVGPLMALHGLHPLTLEDRVARGLKKAQVILEKHGARADSLCVEDGNVRIRLRAPAHGCGSGTSTNRIELEDAIFQAAPDLTSLSIEEEAIQAQGFVPLEMLTAIHG